MFEDIGKPNLVNLLVLGAVGMVLPKVLPGMPPTVGTAVKVVIDLLTESEAEAAEELMEALVSSTIDEINQHVKQVNGPAEARQSVERSVARFKHKALQRAQRWGADHDDRHRHYNRHLRRLHEATKQSQNRHDGWQRDIYDDIGEIIEETG